MTEQKLSPERFREVDTSLVRIRHYLLALMDEYDTVKNTRMYWALHITVRALEFVQEELQMSQGLRQRHP
jgi:hypothetical protein